MFYYLLDENKNLIKTDDVLEWASQFEVQNRVVKKTYGDFNHEGTNHRILISTVFLGLDHGFGDEEPEVFETMAFKVDDSDNVIDWGELLCERHSNWVEAQTRHDDIVSNLSLTEMVEERGEHDQSNSFVC